MADKECQRKPRPNKSTNQSIVKNPPLTYRQRSNFDPFTGHLNALSIGHLGTNQPLLWALERTPTTPTWCYILHSLPTTCEPSRAVCVCKWYAKEREQLVPKQGIYIVQTHKRMARLELHYLSFMIGLPSWQRSLCLGFWCCPHEFLGYTWLYMRSTSRTHYIKKNYVETPLVSNSTRELLSSQTMITQSWYSNFFFCFGYISWTKLKSKWPFGTFVKTNRQVDAGKCIGCRNMGWGIFSIIRLMASKGQYRGLVLCLFIDKLWFLEF